MFVITKLFPVLFTKKKVWKAFKEKSRIIVHLHINVVRMLQETLITMWHRRCAKTSFRIPVLWKHWHFELHVWREYPSSMLARFRVRERNYISVRFIFRISEVRDQPDSFSWLVKNRLTAVQLKTLNSLMCFSQVQNCCAGSRWFSRPRRPKKRLRKNSGCSL